MDISPAQVSIHSKIFANCGHETLKLVRKVENVTVKLVSWKNHLTFNTRCRKSKLTPISLKLKSTVKGQKANNILKNAEIKLLDQRITFCHKTIENLQHQGKELEVRLKQKLPAAILDELQLWLDQKKESVSNQVKHRQTKKFEALKTKQQQQRQQVQKDLGLQNKWVINMSKRDLTAPEKSVLQRGLNFAVLPKSVPVKEIITTTEHIITEQVKNTQQAAEIRFEVTKALRHHKIQTSNITFEEKQAIRTLKNDSNITILPADKGRTTVVMDSETYDQKIQTHLNDTNTYEILAKDPTPVVKNELISLLRTWKTEKSIAQHLYNKIYPTTEEVPKFYGLPKVHKQDTPLRPIVSCTNSVTYQASKHLANILTSYVGHNSAHHIQNSEDFVQKIADLEVTPGQQLVSYDVTALFTSIPVEPTIEIVRKRLEENNRYYHKTCLSKDQIISLLTLVLKSTYFVYRGIFYRQKHGAAMGSPVSPILANLYMEDFEYRALSTYPRPPRVWLRYVDDTFTQQHEYDIETFHQHLNSIDPNIKFTREVQENYQLPFLDTLVKINDDGTTKITIYRKPTHTDQYLNFESNHHIQHKRSVLKTLEHRARTLITEEADQESELAHIKEALKSNGYGEWFFHPQPPRIRREPTREERQYPSRPLPYIRGLSERLSKMFHKHNIRVYHKPINTLRSILVHPKDRVPNSKKCGVVYQINCGDCDSTYIGETARALDARIKEHSSIKRAALTAMGEHCKETSHSFNWTNISVLARENNTTRRKIREALEISQAHPALNRDTGLELPEIYIPLVRTDDVTSSDVTSADVTSSRANTGRRVLTKRL